MKNLRNKNKAGFTLIELLVVIAIIGLLASVVLLALNGARAKSRDAKRIADVRQLASAMELYFNDKNSYPTNGQAFTAATGYIINAANGLSSLVPTYIGILPVAPTPADGTCTAAFSNNIANDYQYYGTVLGVNLSNVYTISFCLGAATGGYSAGEHDLTPAGIQ